MIQVDTNLGEIRIAGTLGLSDYKRVLSALHRVTVVQGYQDITLDLSACASVYAGGILALAAEVARLRERGIDVAIVLPSEDRLVRLFRNAGWSNVLDPKLPAAPTFAGSQHVPAMWFRTPEEQHDCVNRLLDTVLGSLQGLTRHDLGAIEWAVNEVTDNVLVHAESNSGGLVQLTTFAQRNQIEMVVVDAGKGIPNTLRQGYPDLHRDSLALEKAVQEGVTRSKNVGRGNGLFGTIEIARVSGGYLHIHSGYARLAYEDDDLRLYDESIPFNGSLVVACLDCSDPNSLGNALKFEGTRHEPIDIVDPRYATNVGDDIFFDVMRDAQALGSRAAGVSFRTKVENLLAIRPTSRLVLDFSGVNVLSSSFADEVVGKLFQALGPLQFMSRVELRGLQPTVRGLLDRAILQRAVE